ncbi:beta-ketoacyl-ACP synthase III [Porphyromonas circumdentaria]|uniref:beta-ketoacyl-ACP synthase III n=1 Tax=Porphyromonas circumdentaria TaxID=29524 RepID=UPI0026DBC665|nr:beta-ketoacyl-ACP synthase III [Porphyromonas circumdentaria]MDO4721766.1 beta-ketoacyl-ACP synthase III [Porphyromonas circumdentaria]
MNDVFITRTAVFLPNEIVDNATMEDILGMVGNQPSRVKSIILRQNGIKNRYYSLNREGQIVYTNAELTAAAIRRLFDSSLQLEDVNLLACGTSLPDQLLPSHAVMTHGVLGGHPIDLLSASGVCCAGMHAFKHAYLSVLSGSANKAISTGSELVSPVLRAGNFDEEYKMLRMIEEKPIIAFEKDFLRWMLSDGAGAFLFEKERRGNLSLKVEWIESISYANELDVCMYAGAILDKGKFKGWKETTPIDWAKKSYFSIKQDTRLLGSHIINKGIEFAAYSLSKHDLEIQDVNHILPHISSMFFFEQLKQGFANQGYQIEDHKWFINLPYVGNVGSASIYLMLDELFHSDRIKLGDSILLMVPESSRFSYSMALLRAV